MSRALLFALTLFQLLGCSFLVVSEVVSQCDQSNVECGGTPQAEREFKDPAESAALINDIKSSAKFIKKTAQNITESDTKKHITPQLETCEDDEVYVCTMSAGCFCE